MRAFTRPVMELKYWLREYSANVGDKGGDTVYLA